MAGLLNGITKSRGWARVQRNIIDPFSNSISWFFSTLLLAQPIDTPKPGIAERGWGNIAALIPFLLALGLAAVIGLPLAFAWHSLWGFIDAIRWTAGTTWDKDYHRSFSQTNTRNNLQAYLFALPGYLISAPFCLVISLGRVLWEAIKPFLKALVETSGWFLGTLFVEGFTKGFPFEHQGLRNIPAFFGAVVAFTLSVLTLSLAVLKHSFFAFFNALESTYQFALDDTYQKHIDNKRGGLQQLLALPGYVLSLPFCALILIARVIKEIAIPLGEAFIDAAGLGLKALFGTKPEAASQLLTGNFFKPNHSGLRRIPALIGHLIGFAFAALLSPFALIYQTVLGFIDVTGWGFKNIVLNEDAGFQANISERYYLQHGLASPGYLAGLIFCAGILLIRGVFEAVKPFVQGFWDALTKSVQALFDVPADPDQAFVGLRFRDNHNNFQKFAALLGFIPAITLAIPLGLLAFIWHSSVGFFEALFWGSRRLWDDNDKTDFFKAQAFNRYPGQRLLAGPGYALGFFFCLPIAIIRVLYEVIKPFVKALIETGSWFLNALFVEGFSKDFPFEHQGLRNVPAFFGAVVAFILSALTLPFAILKHSFFAFFNALESTYQFALDDTYQKHIDNKRGGLQQLLALPGYLLSLPFCALILVARVIKEITIPLGEAFIDAAGLGLKALFGTKPEAASKLLPDQFFRPEHRGLRRILAFVGHITGFAFSVLFLPLAFLYQTFFGFMDVAGLGIKRIVLNKTAAQAGFQDNISERYTLQHGLASPGYLLGLAFCGVLGIGRLVVEGLLYNILFKGILKPFGEAFLDAAELGFNALFFAKPDSTHKLLSLRSDPFLRADHSGLRRFPAFIGHIVGFILIALLSPFALIYQSFFGFMDVAGWGIATIILREPFSISSFQKDHIRNRYAPQHILASPGYLAGLAFCAFLGVCRLVIQYLIFEFLFNGILKPFGEALVDTTLNALKKLFYDKKTTPPFSFFTKNPDDPRILFAGIGHLVGFAIGLLASPFALVYHSARGAIEVSRWGWYNVIESPAQQEGGLDPKALSNNIRDRYGIQHAFASPGYILGLAFSAVLMVGRILFEIVKPFVQGFWDAFSKSLEALFDIPTPDQAFEGLSFRAKYNAAQRFVALLGFIPAIALAIPFGLVAFIWHSTVGFFEALFWGSRKIWDDGYKTDFFKAQALNRYPGQRLLARPGYALGFILCIPIGLARIIFEAVKPVGQGFIDTMALIGKALFLDRTPRSEEVEPEVLTNFQALGGLKRDFTGWSILPGFIGRLLAIALAIPLMILAWAWQTLNTLADFVAWGTKRMWSKQYTETFKKAMEKRYVGQDALGILGYALGALICVVFSPICLAHRYKSEIADGIKTGVKGLVAFLALVIVGEIKSLVYCVGNILAFLGNLITLDFKAAGLALEKAFVHLLGFISLGILDALYRSTLGRPELVGMSAKDAAGDPEKQKAVKLRKIYNALDNGGALPHTETKDSKEKKSIDWEALGTALATERETPSFAHVYERRVVKSTDFGEDSPTEKALKRITEEFKRESEGPREIKIAPSQQKGFFERRRHIQIIEGMIAQAQSQRDEAELRELENVLDEFIDGHAHRNET